MQRPEGQVTGFGDTQRRFNGLKVTHFADQHYIGIFTKRGSQSTGEAFGVGVQFALIDYTILVHVNELDRILNGEDMVVPFGIDLVNHRGQRGGLTRACGTRNQHQTAGLFA